MKLFFHNFPEVFILRRAGAVAGVENRFMPHHMTCCFVKQSFPGAGRVYIHEVKSAHQHVRPEPLKDVQNVLVGAAAYEYTPPFFVYKQILLMTKDIRLRFAARGHCKPGRINGENAFGKQA